MTAVLQFCPASADPELTARNLVAQARLSDPVAIAEFLGLDVLVVEPIATMGARGARRPGAILISDAALEDDVDGIVAELLGLAVVDLYGLVPECRYAFSKAFAACLLTECTSTSSYWLAAGRR